MWLERLVGRLFIVSGMAKLLGIGEDRAATLVVMARANQGTQLGSLSDWLVVHSTFAIMIVAVIMVATGAQQILHANWFNLDWAKLAALVQLSMIICFVTLMHRGFLVIFMDGFLVMALSALLLESPRKLVSPA